MTEQGFTNIIMSFLVLCFFYTAWGLTNSFVDWNAERDCAATHQVYMCEQDETWRPVTEKPQSTP